jgi:hypothetical protein
MSIINIIKLALNSNRLWYLHKAQNLSNLFRTSVKGEENDKSNHYLRNQKRQYQAVS